MKYKSTRGGVTGLSFKEAVVMGLAADGGLLVPEEIPQVELNKLVFLPYRELAYEVFTLFIDDINKVDLKRLIEKSYTSFSRDEVVGIKKFEKHTLLELYYGPTLSFKDIALQFLGNLFEYILGETKGRLNVLGATSGDTGSAAIYGLKGKKNINVFILYPYQLVSYVQELQMATVQDPNIFNVAIQGTFDDCQKIIKEIFADLAFKKTYSLGAVNSINWVRILAQIVYYFYAYFQMDVDEVDVVVPTGNFGDIFAGFMAKKMGLPIHRLILATNENDILCRFVNKGDYSVRSVIQTISPAMDIQIASNFERYLYYFYGEDGQKTKASIKAFLEKNSLQFSEKEVEKIQEDFISFSIGTMEAKKIIKETYARENYFLCPHTACGVGAAGKVKDSLPKLCLATAHPAKFPEVVEESTSAKISIPAQLRDLDKKEKRVKILPNGVEAVREYIRKYAL